LHSFKKICGLTVLAIEVLYFEIEMIYICWRTAVCARAEVSSAKEDKEAAGMDRQPLQII
jgi:hypothetical protein